MLIINEFNLGSAKWFFSPLWFVSSCLSHSWLQVAIAFGGEEDCLIQMALFTCLEVGQGTACKENPGSGSLTKYLYYTWQERTVLVHRHFFLFLSFVWHWWTQTTRLFPASRRGDRLPLKDKICKILRFSPAPTYHNIKEYTFFFRWA